ncbi:MAG TPA: hypothetical protein PKD83_10230 [Ignavibacteria bacterium]|nr:hypothetical protein [Ignavibacteria bacterium]
MKNFTILLLSVFLISCGGSGGDSGLASPATTIYAPSERFDGDPSDDPELDNLMSRGSCIPPNLKLDVNVNRKYCGTDDCLIQFAGYWWWTNYQYTGSPNWYWNQGQSWSPRNVSVDGEGLHLFVKKDDLGGGSEWMASEVVAVYESDKKTLAKTGYGTYLVSAKVMSSGSWDQLDKNVAFGLFTFQNDKSGPPQNQYRELDLAEVSRWGTPPCSNVSDQRLCTGNSQFAIQDWTKDPANLHRYTIKSGVKEITLVMKWTNAKTPVTFSQYDGKYNLDNLPAQASNTFTTGASQNQFIPDDACQLFHMNLWMGNYGQGNKHPGPSNNAVQEVIVTNFQYRP